MILVDGSIAAVPLRPPVSCFNLLLRNDKSGKAGTFRDHVVLSVRSL